MRVYLRNIVVWFVLLAVDIQCAIKSYWRRVVLWVISIISTIYTSGYPTRYLVIDRNNPAYERHRRDCDNGCTGAEACEDCKYIESRGALYDITALVKVFDRWYRPDSPRRQYSELLRRCGLPPNLIILTTGSVMVLNLNTCEDYLGVGRIGSEIFAAKQIMFMPH